nr:MAG TPA: NinG recombination protein [Caudoviricetes sp.]
MLKACGYCGKIHDINTTCPKKPARHYHKTTTDKLRNTYRWQRKREQIRQDAHHMCEMCKAEGIITTKGLEIHHIIKLSQAPDLLTDDDNLVCLCVPHHKQADNGEINPIYLKQLAQKRHTMN